MGNRQAFCDGPNAKSLVADETLVTLSRGAPPTEKEVRLSLLERVGGGAFVDLLLESLQLSDDDADIRRNIRVDVHSALTKAAPFDAQFTESVVPTIRALDELSSELKNEVVQAIKDATIVSKTGKRCPMTGTLQRDEADLCPITKMGLSIATQKTPLLEELGEERLEKSVENWFGRMRTDSMLHHAFLVPPNEDELQETLGQACALLIAVLAGGPIPSDKGANKMPVLSSEEEFHRVLMHLKDALEAAAVRPMVVAESCNRAGALRDLLVKSGRVSDTTKGDSDSLGSHTPSMDVGLDDDSDESGASLFARLGGETAVSALVETTYANIAKNENLRALFPDIKRIKVHQKVFLTAILSGKPTDTNMKETHKDLKITEEQFDLFIQIVTQAGTKLFDIALVAEMLHVFTRYEPIIVAPLPKKVVKPRPFVMMPPDFELPTQKERSWFKMLGGMHWPRKAREDMVKEIKAKFAKLKPDGSGKISFVPDGDAAFGVNLTLQGAHTPMQRPASIALPPHFRDYIGSMSVRELSKYRATSQRKFLSVYGQVFDVSDRPDKYGVGAPYEELTGKDITWGLACGDDSPPNANKFYDMYKAPENEKENILNKGKKTPDYDMLFARIAGLHGWIAHFQQEYGECVGTLDLYEEEECLSYPPEVDLGCSVM
eukprot:GEMP01019434.1.p1 GENE.GEMP01019434.1~~GEMP01019434.1.p1  ORF type:complete len:662 (+),score=153.93 GEMP01019434.1:75-2060(+)